MNSCDLVVSISAIACVISKGKSTEEIALLGAILSQLGDTLSTIAANQNLFESYQNYQSQSQDSKNSKD